MGDQFPGLAGEIWAMLSASYDPKTLKQACLKIIALEQDRDLWKEAYNSPLPFADPNSLSYQNEEIEYNDLIGTGQ